MVCYNKILALFNQYTVSLFFQACVFLRYYINSGCSFSNSRFISEKKIFNCIYQ